MRKTLVIIALMLSTFAYGQTEKPPTVFNRILIFNESNELLIVKIKKLGFWVTPGLYQTHDDFMSTGLDSISSTYGIRTGDLELRGIFSLQTKSTQEISVRNIFVTQALDIGNIKPDLIEEIKWVSKEQASEFITFPHINLFIDQVMSKPDIVWGGSVITNRNTDTFTAEIVEEFHPLFKRE